jgi:hypothetical protein
LENLETGIINRSNNVLSYFNSKGKQFLLLSVKSNPEKKEECVKMIDELEKRIKNFEADLI